MSDDCTSPDPASSWFYVEGEIVKGPFAFAELQTLLHAGTISPTTQVVPEGSDDWHPLADYLSSAEHTEPQGRIQDPSKRQDGGPAHGRSQRRVGRQAQAAYQPGNRKQKAFLFGCGGCLTLILISIGLMNLLARFVESVPHQPGTGITYSQLTGNGFGDNFKMERSSKVDGRERYMGEAIAGIAVLEVHGDKSDIFKADLVLFMPNDSRETIEANATLALVFLHNVDRAWPESDRVAWLNAAIGQVTEKRGKVTTVRGRNRVSLTDMRPLGFTLSVQSNLSK